MEGCQWAVKLLGPYAAIMPAQRDFSLGVKHGTSFHLSALRHASTFRLDQYCVGSHCLWCRASAHVRVCRVWSYAWAVLSGDIRVACWCL